MNPLSPFGRGVKTQQLAYTNNEMCLLKKQTELLATDNFQIVYIRFPNNEQKPIGNVLLDLFYMFSQMAMWQYVLIWFLLRMVKIDIMQRTLFWGIFLVMKNWTYPPR